MPLYEYECQHCHTRFEKLVANNRAQVACRECGSEKVQQLLSVFTVAVKRGRPVAEDGPCASCGAAQRGICSLR